jgi:hypothetical protein
MKKTSDLKINTLEINQSNLMKQLETMNAENKADHKDIMDVIIRLEEKLDKALDRKANKWVEKAIISFVVLVLTGLSSYLGALIWQTIIHVN